MSSCCNSSNYTAKKNHPTGLKCYAYTFTMHGIYKSNGIYLKGITPSVSYGSSNDAPVVTTFAKRTCCV